MLKLEVQKTPPARQTFPKLDYDTKPKHESKAREIGRAEEAEMMGSIVEESTVGPLHLSFELPFPGYLFLAQNGKVLGNYPVI